MYSDERCRKVHRVLNAGTTLVGALPILTAFAGNHTDYVSPFVLFDEFGPIDVVPNTDPLKVEAHPHAGVTPTTYFVSGRGHYKDSLNYDFEIGTREFIMFSSGSGAIHMEESGNILQKDGGLMHGFQIWLNTPKKYKWDVPSTILNKGESMPTIVHDDITAKVVMGELL